MAKKTEDTNAELQEQQAPATTEEQQTSESAAQEQDAAPLAQDAESEPPVDGNRQATAPSGGTHVKTLTAGTREELLAKIYELKATLSDGQELSAGAIGRSKDDGTYMILVEISDKEQK